LAAAEQGYLGFLDVLSDVTAEARVLVGELGPVHAFAYLTARLRTADPDARAGVAAIAVIRLAQYENNPGG
jgi:hypothetical protein